MSLRELGGPVSPSSAPLTRRELREREEAARAAEARTIYTATRVPQSSPQRSQASGDVTSRSRAKPKKLAKKGAPALNTKNSKNSSESTGRRIGSQLLSVGALLFAGTLLIAVSVPANAFMSDAAVVLPEVQARQTDGVTGQSLVVSDDAVATVLARDSYSITSYAELLRAQYGNAGTYQATTGAVRWPFPYSVPTTDGYGPRPVWVSGTGFHNGVDFTPGNGTPIYAIADGTVVSHSDDNYGFGNHVILQHTVNGQNVQSLYAHMQTGSSPLVAGEEIKVGDFIGLVGDTGNSYGAHLHFEIHLDKVAVDPFAWLTANAVN